MKKRYIRYILMIAIILSIVIYGNEVKAASDKYNIQGYDIDIVVNEDNSFDITEKITAFFKIPQHGIIRRIPLSNRVKRLNGTSSKNKAIVTDINVSENYSLSTNNGNRFIKIGDADKNVVGSHMYKIQYKYSIGKDPLKNEDELYYNLIGDSWDTTIDNITFKISMPKPFDKTKLGFSSGSEGKTDSSNISYVVNDNVISGSVNKTLDVAQGLTIRLALPEGYFNKIPMRNLQHFSICLAITIIFVGIAWLIWYKHGRDEKTIETVEFYPPEGFNSAEVGMLYNGKVGSKDVLSLLIYLADKGYLKIEEIDAENDSVYKKVTKITKLKEYDGNNENEKLFFEGLFTEKDELDEINQRDSVTDSELYDSFYKTIRKIKSNYNCKKNKSLIFDLSTRRKYFWFIIMATILFSLITLKPVIEFFYDEGMEIMAIMALLFSGVGFSVTFGGLFSNEKIINKIALVIWGVSFGGIPWAFMVYPALKVDTMYLISYIVGFAGIITIIAFMSAMPKRTKFGIEMLGKVKGFRNYLQTAEKSQLEKLVEENPKYFYNILPYTYALGVSDKWMKQFETISLQAPDWYGSSSGFSTSTFSHFMSSTMNHTMNAMDSSPSVSSGSSGGSSSSGGGSSGGGSGGGGGSSW